VKNKSYQTTRVKRYIWVVLAFLVFCGSIFYIFRGIHVDIHGDDKPQFHGDEAQKIAASYFFQLFFVRHDFKNPAWTEDFYARTNPPVAKYIFGAVLTAFGHRVDGFKLQEEFHGLWRLSDELRRRVPDDMLRVTRMTSAVFGALVCLLLFITNCRIVGAAAGLIAVLLLIGNPDFLRYSRLGLTDTILLFHLILFIPICQVAVWALMRDCQGVHSERRGKQLALLLLVAGILPGFGIALATGSKLNGVLTGPIFAVGMFLAAGRCSADKPLWRRIGLALLLVGLAVVVAFAVFIAINPYYYHKPISKAIRALDVYRDWIIKQQLEPGGGLFGFWQRVSTIGYFCLRSPAQPIVRIFESIGLGWLGGWLASLGFTVGLGRLFSLCLARPQQATDQADAEMKSLIIATEAGVVASWVLIITVFFTLRWPLAWVRYMLPPYLAICMTMAIGIASLVRVFRKLRILFSPESDVISRLRALIGPLSAIAISSILALTPWLIKPALVPPNIDIGFTEAEQSALYTEAVSAKPNSSILRHHLGMHFMRVGKILEANKEFSTALKILAQERADDHTVAIQRYIILDDLIRLYLTLGDYFGVADFLSEQIAMVKKLRDGMASDDPVVLGEFNRLIYNRRFLLDRLKQSYTGQYGLP
jgi:hypothetical protein